jgi:hypothetical protein
LRRTHHAAIPARLTCLSPRAARRGVCARKAHVALATSQARCLTASTGIESEGRSVEYPPLGSCRGRGFTRSIQPTVLRRVLAGIHADIVRHVFACICAWRRELNQRTSPARCLEGEKSGGDRRIATAVSSAHCHHSNPWARVAGRHDAHVRARPRSQSRGEKSSPDARCLTIAPSTGPALEIVVRSDRRPMRRWVVHSRVFAIDGSSHKAHHL